MSIKPPFTQLEIDKSPTGFYQGYSLPIALISKISMAALVIWALVFPGGASSTLSTLNNTLLQTFNPFYVLVVAFFTFFLLLIAILPSTGRRKMGAGAPEFSNFSWFSMMFGAGLGVGLMVFATAEPLGLWGSNPLVVSGENAGGDAESLTGVWRYTFLHYGFHAWAIYVVTGLSLAYYAYTRNMPLTIRSALTPLFGKGMNGIFGHIVDVLGVVATILGVSVTIGFGVSQFVHGLYGITGMDWMMNGAANPEPSTVGLISALVVIMGLSIISAVSGVEKGIRYLSNLNLVLSLILLSIFIIFGSFLFAMTSYATAFVDYIVTFIPVTFEVFYHQSEAEFISALPSAVASLPAADVSALYSGSTGPWGSLSGFEESVPASLTALNDPTLAATVYEAGSAGRLFNWQAAWSTFYWAWWIAFSPFVGLFLARISKGRTIREFILGCMIAPALVCFAWMTILGGTAIDLELTGVADGAIKAASNTDKLFTTLEYMLSSGALWIVTAMCVVLILTFLVTSADSGILVMNTIMSGGQQQAGVKHRIIWGVILTAVIGSLIIAAGGDSGGGLGLSTLRSAMIIGALPFAFVMLLMCLSLGKALYRDGLRDQ